MKLRRKFLPLFALLLLCFILVFTACGNDAELEQTAQTPAATDTVISNNTNETDAEPTLVLTAATIAPQETETPEESEAVDAPAPTFSPTVVTQELVDPTATPEATDTPEAIPTPELKAFVTPKSRTLWRAGSGELFIPFDNGIKNFQYYLYVPEHWYGFFEMRQDTDDIFLFNYLRDEETKQEVFRVQAFPEHIWAEKKAAGDSGTEFYSLRNVTFVYYAASENPFEGEEGELFQQMIDDVPEIITEELSIVSRRFNKDEK